MREPRCEVVIVLVLVSGCYLSHTPREGEPPPDAAAPDVRGATSCASDVATLDLGTAPGCVSMLVAASPDAIACDGSSVVGTTVLARRERTGPWSYLLRSRGRPAGTLCGATVMLPSCTECRDVACVTGSDLEEHGVGGSLPDLSEVRLAIDNGGESVWVRICSPPL